MSLIPPKLAAAPFTASHTTLNAKSKTQTAGTGESVAGERRGGREKEREEANWGRGKDGNPIRGRGNVDQPARHLFFFFYHPARVYHNKDKTPARQKTFHSKKQPRIAVQMIFDFFFSLKQAAKLSPGWSLWSPPEPLGVKLALAAHKTITRRGIKKRPKIPINGSEPYSAATTAAFSRAPRPEKKLTTANWWLGGREAHS